MTEKQAYSYTVLRYVHDVVSGEALNVGVVMHAPAAGFLEIRTRTTMGRLKQAFPDLDCEAFTQAMQAVCHGFSTVAKQAGKMPLFDAHTDARAHALKVLPDDDSALQWSPTGTGMTTDPTRTLDRLYERYVTRYESTPVRRRSDDDVWRPVRDKLLERGVNVPFKPKAVVGTQDQIKFEKAWQKWTVACLRAGIAGHGRCRRHQGQGTPVARPSGGRRRRYERGSRTVLSTGPSQGQLTFGRLRNRQDHPRTCALCNQGCRRERHRRLYLVYRECVSRPLSQRYRSLSSARANDTSSTYSFVERGV